MKAGAGARASPNTRCGSAGALHARRCASCPLQPLQKKKEEEDKKKGGKKNLNMGKKGLSAGLDDYVYEDNLDNDDDFM